VSSVQEGPVVPMPNAQQEDMLPHLPPLEALKQADTSDLQSLFAMQASLLRTELQAVYASQVASAISPLCATLKEI
jgi:hypothetical protein